MNPKLEVCRKKRYTEAPERKAFGWSHYTMEILTIEFPFKNRDMLVQEAVVTGKKLCLFHKFIWDYQLEVLSYKQFTRKNGIL
jgi:hypothetical protein